MCYRDLNNNQLSGTIPPALGSLNSLQALGLENNQLSGTIPTVLGSLTGLQLLNLDYNQLSGTIPSTFGSLTRLMAMCVPRGSAGCGGSGARR